jgi:ribonuclease HII
MNNVSYKYLIGIDEVGRGPLAGPVAVGAFLIPVSNLIKTRKIFRGVKESKQLNEKRREVWFAIIQNAQKEGTIDFHVSFQSEKIIDDRRRGLAYAIRTALKKSLDGVVNATNTSIHCGCQVTEDKCRVLLDGGLKAPAEYVNQETIIKGDEKEMVIALASICAKVLRDRKLVRLATKYPRYGFDVHKGYGTKAHYSAIKRHGMCMIHRRSFLKHFNELR